jgi:glycosidase
MPTQSPSREHISHPLTQRVLSRINLSPDFNYPLIENSRTLAAKLTNPPSPFSAGEISAIGLIGQIYLKLVEDYLHKCSLSVFDDLDEMLVSRFESSGFNEIITAFLNSFPTPDVYKDQAIIDNYLFISTENKHKRHLLYKSIILILVADTNPAIRAGDGLFTSPDLRSAPLYKSFLSVIENYFSDQPDHDSAGISLLDLLRAPSTAYPHSIQSQLNYIRQNWSSLLGEGFFNELLLALGRINEENKPFWTLSEKSVNPLIFSLASYNIDSDIIRFSQDFDWMPRLILLAKNAFVWMDQLSKKYRREIYHLDQIPDQELEYLSGWGITGLWLIGIWQRDPASQKIKRMCGNPDAVPSAYSIYDYVIADALGGEAAFENLSSRAQSFNIRLAADMVPNHMGISSKWVIENPERFLSLDQPPFPSYSYNGPDLADDPRVSIFLEDHYFDKSDASVVFKRVDNHTGNSIYIYHGNDGTALPWNDTAQLDFLQQRVRESVIQTILQVARKFPIIRFDAAMTLAKKHFQRLWFPEPGTGGAIPTRTDFGVTKLQFDQLMTVEFWREVVDRVADESPDTLLLAEAFWMMEGYFVRTLGMHRVYNSAFMHMFRNENNAEYRDLLKKTLEFDPEILKRYVNFMSNPDEDTAISQFGSDGKYFGVCIMMSTLPGLPMIGHGQIEGYSEKYGMEYQRAYYNEQPNQNLIDRHRREVFPLLHKRYLFAEAANFVLYDFVLDDGTINQDVFAHSNQAHGESALILYHNKYAAIQGTIIRSTEIKGKTQSLLDGLGLNSPDSSFILFREHITGLEYIRSKDFLQENGLRIDLGAYQYQVFLDFKEIVDTNGDFSLLDSSLQGFGVPNLQEKLTEIKLSPLLEALDNLISSCFSEFLSNTFIPFAQNKGQVEDDSRDLEFQFSQRLSTFTTLLARIHPDACDFPPDYHKLISSRLEALNKYYKISVIDDNSSNHELFALLFWVIFSELFELIPYSLLLDIFRLSSTQPAIKHLLKPSGNNLFIASAEVLVSLSSQLNGIGLSLNDISAIWFSSEEIRDFLIIHNHDGITWFNQEAFCFLLDLTLGIIYINFQIEKGQSTRSKQSFDLEIRKIKKFIISSLKSSTYNLDLFESELSKYPGLSSK